MRSAGGGWQRTYHANGERQRDNAMLESGPRDAGVREACGRARPVLVSRVRDRQGCVDAGCGVKGGVHISHMFVTPCRPHEHDPCARACGPRDCSVLLSGPVSGDWRLAQQSARTIYRSAQVIADTTASSAPPPAALRSARNITQYSTCTNVTVQYIVCRVQYSGPPPGAHPARGRAASSRTSRDTPRYSCTCVACTVHTMTI